MTCSDMVLLIPDWVEGRLDAASAAQVAAHAATCAHCAAEAEVWKRFALEVTAQVTADSPVAVPGLTDRIVAAVTAEAQSQPKRKMRTTPLLVTTFALSALLLCWTLPLGPLLIAPATWLPVLIWTLVGLVVCYALLGSGVIWPGTFQTRPGGGSHDRS